MPLRLDVHWINRDHGCIHATLVLIQACWFDNLTQGAKAQIWSHNNNRVRKLWPNLEDQCWSMVAGFQIKAYMMGVLSLNGYPESIGVSPARGPSSNKNDDIFVTTSLSGVRSYWASWKAMNESDLLTK